MKQRYANQIHEWVRPRVASVEPLRFRQEQNYMMAVLGALNGQVTPFDGGKLFFRTTGVDDKGRGAAENTFGADFALSASITKISERTGPNFACCLGQAKKGVIESLVPSKLGELDGQIAKMWKYSKNSVLVAETPDEETKAPSELRCRRVLASSPRKLNDPETLGDLIILMCDLEFGDQGYERYEAMQDARLATLGIFLEH